MYRHLLATVLSSCAVSLAIPAFAADEFPVPQGFTSGFETVDGVQMHYVKGGSGPLVYLVHGFGQTWYEWHQLMPELAKHHTVVAPDLPGLGQSSAPKSYRATDIAPILYKLAQRFSGNQKFDVVSHDIGIWNTYPMIVKNQNAIRRAIFMEAPIPEEAIYTFPAFTAEGESLVWHFSFFAATEQLPEKLVTGNERFFLEHFIKSHAANTSAFSPELFDLYGKSFAKPETLHASFEYYRVLNQGVKDNKELAKTKIGIPMMAIGGGGRNGLGTYEAEMLQRFATNVTGKVLPGCGHWLPEECTASLNDAVEKFLDTP